MIQITYIFYIYLGVPHEVRQLDILGWLDRYPVSGQTGDKSSTAVILKRMGRYLYGGIEERQKIRMLQRDLSWHVSELIEQHYI